MFKIAKNKPKDICVAYRCKNRKAQKSRFCPKHAHRYQKEKNPVNYTYNLLKVNAKRRGKPFNLTLGEFKQFCEDTNYMELKGKHKKALSIDRIDPTKGYSIDNMQVLTLGGNGYKGAYEKPPF